MSTQCMMRRYIIDRFGHPLVHPYRVSLESSGGATQRAADESIVDREYLERFYVEKATYNLLADRVLALEKQLKETADNCLQLSPDGLSWNGRDKPLSNVSPGVTINDVGTMKQVCIYNEETSSIICGGVVLFNISEFADKIVDGGKRLNTVEQDITAVGTRVKNLETYAVDRDSRLTSVENFSQSLVSSLQTLETNLVTVNTVVTNECLRLGVDGKWNARDKIIAHTASGTSQGDVSTIDQTCSTEDCVEMNNRLNNIEAHTGSRDARVSAVESSASTLLARVGQLESDIKTIDTNVKDECIRLDVDGRWDAKNKVICNTAAGTSHDEVSTMAQTCTYEESVDNFRCGTKYFDLVQNSTRRPIVYAKWEGEGYQLKLYGTNKEFFPVWAVRYDVRWHHFEDHQSREIAWDEKNKRFGWINSGEWSKKHPG